MLIAEGRANFTFYNCSVHPSYVNLAERNGLGWLNGFNELLCRCGLASQGPPGDDGGEKLTLHGRIANLPATQVEAAIISNGPGALEVRGTVEEATFFGHCYRLDTTFHMVLGENRARLTDVITNLGARPAPLSLLYHINLGQPFLEKGATVTVPSRDVVPRDARSGAQSADWNRYGGPQPGFAEEGFFFNPLPDADGWAPEVGFVRGFPAARDPKAGIAWLARIPLAYLARGLLPILPFLVLIFLLQIIFRGLGDVQGQVLFELGFLRLTANSWQIVVVGRSMRRMLEVAREVGYLDERVPATLDEREAAALPRERILFLVTGSPKAPVVRKILNPRSEDDWVLPAALVAPEAGRLIWMLDHSAASQLPAHGQAVRNLRP